MVIGNLTALNFGASMVYPSEGFDPVAALECVSKYKTTLLYGVPTMFISMYDEYERNKDKYDISTLRSGFISGSGTPEVLMQRLIKDMVKDLTTGYG
jgi:fatty-acyl-CoA synthase